MSRYGDIIRKGTIVQVRTTNGGDAAFVLSHDYRHTYDAVVLVGDGWTIIDKDRIAAIEPVTWADPVC